MYIKFKIVPAVHLYPFNYNAITTIFLFYLLWEKTIQTFMDLCHKEVAP